MSNTEQLVRVIGDCEPISDGLGEPGSLVRSQYDWKWLNQI
ncbi:hypothetical protein GCM10011357_17740 [Lacimicrobium alkaliphilum]|uniref:Uncharacterized protein n=1 Tax=Lacimicrobium alkaliphilum TaxID=1526571 RepID=A0ABQ1RBX0_9ALTE|nr:hypothetical protein GCM10011357_17740 [Lacimicrobium alkaliphilum]